MIRRCAAKPVAAKPVVKPATKPAAAAAARAPGRGPVGRMQANLATALKHDPNWEEF